MLLFFGSFLLGRFAVAPETLFRILWDAIRESFCTLFGMQPPAAAYTGQERAVVLNIRLPRVALSALVGAGLSVRAGGASGGDDALAMCIAHVTGMGIQWAYLSTDLVVLGLSLTYIPLRRIGYSLLTVLISGQLIGLVQRLPLPWDKPRPEAAE